jgi:DNA-binding transcriptional ArsR family regulator
MTGVLLLSNVSTTLDRMVKRLKRSGDGKETVNQKLSKLRAPLMSKHLRLLRAAGLVASRKDGTAQICALNAKPLRAINAWLREYEAFWSERMRGLKRYVEQTEQQKTKKPTIQ